MLIKRNESEAVQLEAENILFTSEDISEDLNKLAARKNVAIYIANSEGEMLYKAEYIFNSKNGSIPKRLFYQFYNDALENGGQYVEEFEGLNLKNSVPPTMDIRPEERPVQGNPIIEDAGKGALSYTIEDNDDADDEDNWQEHFRQNYGNEMARSIMRIKILSIGGEEYVLMINSVLTPVDATVETLKSQLLLISGIMVLFAFCFAYISTGRISKSIIKMNESAKRLADRDYDVEFDSFDYREVAQLSDTLNFATKELHKTEKLQKELIANVSHDLRTPLTMIKGYAEVMRDIPGENTPENIQVIIDETERLTGLVNDMLDISKLQAGTIALNAEQYNLTESIRQVLGRYNKLQEVDGYIIKFVAAEDIFVIADEQKIYQVLYNLVNNAINYTGDNKTVIVEQIIEKETVLIEVTDSGKGVAEADLPLVWDRYYKVDKAHKRAVQGTGLGLSIVKNILELHEATFGVRNNEGGGATFWFRLPIDHP